MSAALESTSEDREAGERSERALHEAQADLGKRVADRAAELASVNAVLKLEIAERKRAEEALRRRLEDVAILYTVATVGAESTSEDELIESALQVMAGSASGRRVGLWLVEEGALRTFRPPRDSQAGSAAGAGAVLPFRGLAAQVVTDGQLRLIADLTHEEQPLPGQSNTRSMLCVPLNVDGRVIGVLQAESPLADAFGEADEHLLTACAEQLATAVEKIRLFQAEAQRRRELEALEAISSGLRQAETREAMLRFTVQKSVEALGADAGALMQVEGRALVLRAECGRSTDLLGRPHAPMDCAHWHAVTTGEPLYITGDAGQTGLACRCEICAAMMQGMAAGVLVPLKTAEATIGLLHLVYGSPREFSDEQRHLLTTIAEITGSALHRAGVLETLEQRVEDRTRELATLYEVSAASSEALDLQTMLEGSLERVLKAMGSSTATIHLLDEAGENLRLAAHQTVAPSALAEIDLATPPPAVQDWLIVRGEPLVIPDMAADSQMCWRTGARRPCTYAGAPMSAAGRRLGMLGVVRDADQQFSIEEVALLASVADEVAVAVENARLRQQAEQMAIVEERARLARELHDSVTQCLSSVTLLAQAASDFSEAGEWGRVKHYLERIRDTGGQALKEMRLLLFELKPPSTEQEDLVEMLTGRLDAVEERAGVNVRLLTADWPRLPALAEEALYRIAEEALNNALKHSGASVVTIDLRGSPDGIELEVNDDGTGFDPESARRKGGIGLLSMQQRAERLGGQLSIRSAPGEGTSVKVNLRT